MARTASSAELGPAEFLSNGSSTRLFQEDGQWVAMLRRPSGWLRLGALPAATAAELLRCGKLSKAEDGTLVPAEQTGGIGGNGTAASRLGPAEAQINDRESPLAWLRTRKDKSGLPLISDEQFIAGERLRVDFERSMLSQRVTSNWDPDAAARRSGGNVSSELSDGALSARQRFRQAMDAAGPELSSILYQVCCLAAGLEQAERLLDLPKRSGKAVLGLALSALVRHYGLSGRSRTTGQQSSHWGAADYRPSIPDLEDA